MTTIPVSEVVTINPSVLPTGGSAFNLTGLLLTQSTRVPIGAVLSFANAAAVGAFFGLTSLEYTASTKYFGGYDGSNKKPGNILVAQYNTASVPAYVRGGNLSGMTLTQLQALNGTLSVTIDGILKTGTINLSGATSFTNAGQLIATTLAIHGPAAAAFTGVIAATQLTASSVTGTPIAIGQEVVGAGVTAGTYITAFGTGTGGAGTYTVSQSQTVGSVAMTTNQPAVSYDSQSSAFVVSSGTAGASSTITYGSGAMGTSLLLTQATGAVLSQGSIAAVPASFMGGLIQVTQKWALFGLCFNPDQSGNDIRYAFAQWASSTNNRFGYVDFDSDASPCVTVPSTTSLAQRIKTASLSGISSNWQLSTLDPANVGNLSAFVMGIAASLDFTQRNGRTVFKFRRQAGLEPSVTDQTTFDNLKANGYNAYGAYASASDDFFWYADGLVSGPFTWMDSFVNQIWLNANFQSALVSFLLNTGAVPYNALGRSLIEAALNDTIQQGLRFGLYRAGVTLSSSQIAAVNASAGKDIASTLANQGWYLLVGDATPQVRAARGSPPIAFYYVDGQSVQTINLSSIALA